MISISVKRPRLSSNQQLVKFLLSLQLKHGVSPAALSYYVGSGRVPAALSVALQKRFKLNTAEKLLREIGAAKSHVEILLKTETPAALKAANYIYDRLPLKSFSKQFKKIAQKYQKG